MTENSIEKKIKTTKVKENPKDLIANVFLISEDRRNKQNDSNEEGVLSFNTPGLKIKIKKKQKYIEKYLENDK